jgi:hypothetical protein
LDNVEHPHREPRAAVDAGPPSQAGASIEGRPRTAGSFQFKTRPIPTEPEPSVAVPNPESQPLPPRQPAKPVSVQAAKKLFEGKLPQNRSAPQTQPSRAAVVVKGTSTQKTSQVKQTSLPSYDEPTPTTSQTALHAPKRKESDPTLPIPRPPPHAATQAVPSQRTNPFFRPKVESSRSNVVVTKATERQDVPVPKDGLASTDTGGDGIDPAPGTSPINVSDTFPYDVRSLGFEGHAAQDGSREDEASKAHAVPADRSSRTHSRQSSEKIVRSSTALNPTSAAETGEVRTPVDRNFSQKGPRLGLGRDVRRAVGEDEGPSVRDKFGHRRSQNAFLGTAAQHDSSESTTEQKAAKTSTTFKDSAEKSIGVLERVDHIAARGFSYDGTSPESEPPYSATPPRTPTPEGGSMESDQDNFEVPHDVDCRTAYGRRTTQDFGFPGAGIKSRATSRSYMASKDPGKRVKGTCGHFSHMAGAAGCEYGSRQPCRRCSKIAPLFDSCAPKRRRIRRRASTESSLSSSSSSSVPRMRNEHRSKRRQCRSEDVPADRCGESLCTDLGLMIDVILKEHSNSLRGIIGNIERTRPGIANIRRLSKRMVKHCEAGGACTTSCGACEIPYPCCPPKAAEKLNVGPPGQLKPSVNDSRSNLREAVQTVPDLVDLVNSAADNFGLDLDRRPTAHDDRVFEDAPVAGSEHGSESFSHDDPTHYSEENSADEEQRDDEHRDEDPWLQQTRRHLAELAEARTQMLDELDAIAGPYLAQLEDHLASGHIIDSPRRRLSRLSAQLSRRSTRLRNDSVGQASRGLTHKDLQELAHHSPGLTPEWFDLAQAQLPAAIESIASVLESLPGSVYQSSNEVSEAHFVQSGQSNGGEYRPEQPYDEKRLSGPAYDEQPSSEPAYKEHLQSEPVYRRQSSYKPKYDTEPEFEYEAPLEPEYDQDDHPSSPPQRTHTDTIFGLYDRIIEIGRALREDTMLVTSPRYSMVEAETAEGEQLDERTSGRVTTHRTMSMPREQFTSTPPEVETAQSFSSDL